VKDSEERWQINLPVELRAAAPGVDQVLTISGHPSMKAVLTIEAPADEQEAAQLSLWQCQVIIMDPKSQSQVVFLRDTLEALTAPPGQAPEVDLSRVDAVDVFINVNFLGQSADRTARDWSLRVVLTERRER
jgi:hypothetical protein